MKGLFVDMSFLTNMIKRFISYIGYTKYKNVTVRYQSANQKKLYRQGQ